MKMLIKTSSLGQQWEPRQRPQQILAAGHTWDAAGHIWDAAGHTWDAAGHTWDAAGHTWDPAGEPGRLLLFKHRVYTYEAAAAIVELLRISECTSSGTTLSPAPSTQQQAPEVDIEEGVVETTQMPVLSPVDDMGTHVVGLSSQSQSTYYLLAL